MIAEETQIPEFDVEMMEENDDQSVLRVKAFHFHNGNHSFFHEI